MSQTQGSTPAASNCFSGLRAAATDIETFSRYLDYLEESKLDSVKISEVKMRLSTWDSDIKGAFLQLTGKKLVTGEDVTVNRAPDENGELVAVPASEALIRRRIYSHFIMLRGVGPETVDYMLQSVRSVMTLFDYKPRDLQRMPGIGPKKSEIYFKELNLLFFRLLDEGLIRLVKKPDQSQTPA